MKECDYDSFRIDVHRRASFDPRPVAHQVKQASQETWNGFIADLTANSYNTLWEVHCPILYEDGDISETVHKVLVKQCQSFIQNLFRVPQDAILHHPAPNHVWFEMPSTENQSHSSQWMASRSVRVTASIAYKVLHLKEGKLNFLMEHLWGMNHITTVGMKYGIENEPKAKEKYLQYRRTIDNTAIIDEKCGLVIRTDYPQLGCSPDAVIYSRTENPRLLEIKCPYSLRKADPNEFENVLSKAQLSRFCLTHNTVGDLVLKETHPYYYQIQLSLGILGFQEADLAVYSKEGLVVVKVPYNKSLWLDIAPKLKKIHKKLIVPEYFLVRAPRNVPPIEVDY